MMLLEGSVAVYLGPDKQTLRPSRPGQCWESPSSDSSVQPAPTGRAHWCAWLRAPVDASRGYPQKGRPSRHRRAVPRCARVCRGLLPRARRFSRVAVPCSGSPRITLPHTIPHAGPWGSRAESEGAPRPGCRMRPLSDQRGCTLTWERGSLIPLPTRPPQQVPATS